MASPTVAMEVTGLKELAAQLNVLNDDIRKRVAHAAVFAGAKIIRDRAIRNIERQVTAAEDAARVPDPYLRYLRDNIIAPRGRGSGRRDRFWYVVTVRHKGKALKQPPRYGRTQSKLKFVGVGGRRKGRFKLKRVSYAWNLNPYTIGIYNEFGTVRAGPQPFMRPAFDSGKGDALNATIARLRARIDKANRVVR